MEEVYQVIARLVDGKTRVLGFTSPLIPVISIKARIHEITSIPVHEQRLLSNGRQLEDGTLLSSDGRRQFPAVHLLLRLRGGKGGFGSLLRGAATKAGQKKTNNFDACRDMSGRRLRHVNAEKKMEEWRAEAEDRRLEKIAEEFIKKKAKVAKKDGGAGDAAEKYVEKYRKDSAKCMEEVDKSVRESIGGFAKSKRKGAAMEGNKSKSKRLKIWKGKRKLNESDSDDSDEDNSDDSDEDNSDDETRQENEKSVVINDGSNSDSNKEAEWSSGSVNGGKLDRELSGGCSTDSGSEEDKATCVNGRIESSKNPNGGTLNSEGDGPSEPTLEIREESIVQNKIISSLEVAAVSGIEAVESEIVVPSKTESGNVEEIVCQPTSISSVEEVGASDAEANGNSDFKATVHEETVAMNSDIPDVEKPLNFDEFSSATEMEVLGMERLKSELQGRGLKCGGTLQERAARIFLLKTTPVEKLPKKLLAKK